MDVYKLIEALNAEIAVNRATALIDGKRVVIAKVGADGLELTEAGQELANAQTEPAPKAKAAKPKAATVEDPTAGE